MSSKNADDAGRSGQYFNKKTTKPEFVGGFSTSAQIDYIKLDRETQLNYVPARRSFANQIEEQARNRLNVIQAAYHTDMTQYKRLMTYKQSKPKSSRDRDFHATNVSK